MGIDASIREFLGNRLGLFIHFGVYSLPGGEWNGKTIPGEQGEWIMNYLQIPIREYEKIASRFHPAEFDADKVVRLAHDAGMRYIVITSKHHDGFAMFRSKWDRYNIYDWAGFGRDIVGELAAACKKHGVKLGLYYSQALDWHEPHAGGWHVGPYGLSPSWGNIWDYPDNSVKRFELYFEKKVRPQITELLTNYGDIFLMWFDTPLTISAQQSGELYSLVKSLQPDCLVNSRIGNGKGDYGSLGDNEIPTVPLAKPYESPMTLNDTWGYNRLDDNWKSGQEIIGMLAKLASRNVNFLVNIGPTGSGEIPGRSVEILEDLAKWMKLNGEGIHNTSGNPSHSDFEWGFVTAKDRTLYAFVREDDEQTIEMNGLLTRVADVVSVGSGRHCVFEQTVDPTQGNCRFSVKIPRTGTFLPAFAIVCKDAPEFDAFVCQQGKCLTLYPIHSELFDGKLKDARSVLEENEFTEYSAFGRMKIKGGGILTGWREGGHYLEWTARFVEAGEYDVEIVTSGEGYPDSARNDSHIAVTLSGGRVEAVLTKDDSFSDSRYNKNGVDNTRVVTSCGRIGIDGPGLRTIRLTLLRSLEPDYEIPLISLRFVKT